MKKVLILLPKGFEFLEAAAFIDVVGWTRDVIKKDIEIILCGLTQEVSASFGSMENPFIVKTNIVIEDVDVEDYDALAIPGGFGKYGYYEEGFDERVLTMITAFERVGKLIASVCTAALLLGKSGILKNRKATVYNKDGGVYFRQLSSYCEETCNEEIVFSDNVITSVGPDTAPLVALKMIEKLFSYDVAQDVGAAMGFSVGEEK